MSDINSDYPKYKTEKTVLAILKQISKECKITPYKSQNHKYTLEFFETSLDDTLEKTLKKEFKNLKPQTVIAVKMKLSKQCIEIQLKGVEYPIIIKCKRRSGEYNQSVCELYRALRLRKDQKKGIDADVISENVEQKLKNELAKSIGKENKLKNIKDSMQKFFGSANLRDLLFEYQPNNKKFPLKYRKFVHIKTLKKLNIHDFAIKDSLQKCLRYFKFDFKKELWVEQEKPTKKKKTNNTQ